MTSWQTQKLGELLTIRHGRNQREVESADGEYPILGTGGEMGRATKYLYDKPSVLIGRKGTIDKPRYMDTPFWTVDTLFYSEIKSENVPKFLYYVFNTIDWKRYNEASGVPSLSASTISTIKVNIPEKREQQRIVGVLEVWDEYIEKLEQKIALKEQLKKGLMQQLLTGKHRLPSFSEKWIVRKMGEFAKESRVKEGDNDVHKRLTVRLHLKGVEARGVRGTEAVDSTQYYRRSAGQLIYGKQNIFKGSIGVVPALYDGYASSQDIPSFDIEEAVANVYYIYYYLSRKSIYEWLENFAGGSGSKRLHTSEFYNIKIQLPSLEEQDAIVEVLQLALKEIETLKKHRDVLTKQKKYLLKNLITGTIRTPEDLQPLDTSRLERSAL